MHLLFILDKGHNILLQQQTNYPTSRVRFRTGSNDASPHFLARTNGQRMSVPTRNEHPATPNVTTTDADNQHPKPPSTSGPSFKELFHSRTRTLRQSLYERRSTLTVGDVNDLTTIVHREGFRAGKRSVAQHDKARADTQTEHPPSSSNPPPGVGSGGTLTRLRLIQVPRSLNSRYLFILVPLVFSLVVLVFHYNTGSQPAATGDSDAYFEGLS